MKIRVSGLTVILNNRQILASINLEAASGEFVGIVGPNGSGKSTLLRCLYRVLRPLEGKIYLNENDVWKLSPRFAAQQIAVLLQETGGDFDFTVEEIVLMGRAPHRTLFGSAARADEEIARQCLEQVEAIDLIDRSFLTLSGGEKQRVLLARALAQQPKVLVLDEPTNHLDVRHQLELLKLVRETGLTVVAALHDLNLAAAYCDRIYVLSNGRVAAAGAPFEVLTATLVEQIFGVRAASSAHPVTGRTQLAFYLSEDEPGGEERR